MKGILIYSQREAERNRAAVRRYLEAFAGELSLVYEEELLPALRRGELGCALPGAPSFALVRTMNPPLSRALEALGVRVFNSAATSALCNDKRETYLRAAQAGIAHVPSVFYYRGEPLFLDGRGAIAHVSAGCGSGAKDDCAARAISKAGDTAAEGQNFPLAAAPGADRRSRDAAVKRGYGGDAADILAQGGAESHDDPRCTESEGDRADLLSRTVAFALARFSLPLVVKPACGHGGKGVALCKTEEELRAAVSAIAPDAPLFQPPTGERGVDVRVYLLGGELFAAMERRGAPGDFRSNFCLGGTARRLAPPPALQEAVGRVCALAAFDYAGADFLREGERYLLNELEDVVGARMLYTHTELDPIAAFAAHIRRALSTN